MRMRDVLWQIWLNCGYFLTVAASGFFLYKLCAPFVRPRNGRFWRVLLFLTLAGSTPTCSIRCRRFSPCSSSLPGVTG